MNTDEIKKLLNSSELINGILNSDKVEVVTAKEYNQLLNGTYAENHIDIANKDGKCMLVMDKDANSKYGLSHVKAYRQKK